MMRAAVDMSGILLLCVWLTLTLSPGWCKTRQYATCVVFMSTLPETVQSFQHLSSIIAQLCLEYVYLSLRLSSFFLPERLALLLLSSLWNICLDHLAQLYSSSILVYFWVLTVSLGIKWRSHSRSRWPWHVGPLFTLATPSGRFTPPPQCVSFLRLPGLVVSGRGVLPLMRWGPHLWKRPGTRCSVGVCWVVAPWQSRLLSLQV